MGSRRLRAALAIVLAVTGVGAIAHAWDVDRPATVATQAERLDTPDPGHPTPVLLTSDSAWLAIKTYGALDAVRGFDHLLALASCRRRVITSCRNYDGSVPPSSLAVVEAKGDQFEVLIQAAGYDDSDRNFAGEVERTITVARGFGYRRVMWVTLRANVTYDSGDGYADVYRRNNDTLAALARSGAYPDLVIADWATYAHDRPLWFSADGIHMTRRGAYAAADYISRKMAHLEGRACPMPEVPGGPVQAPCPDPDVTGPVADIDQLYPVTRSSPQQGLALIWEGRGGWPDPPWWEAG